MFEVIEISRAFGNFYGIKQRFTLPSRTRRIVSAAIVLDPLKMKDVAVLLDKYGVPIIGRWTLLLNDESDEVILDANILSGEDLRGKLSHKTMNFPILKSPVANLRHTVITKLDDLLIDSIKSPLNIDRATDSDFIKNLSAYLYLETA